ncbi:MAG: ADP-ribose pyrophosphatase [Parcubacteria group bacterium]|nr:ADP-ribose pyrophosphatase [Parcubacteria group bacterium]
MRRVSLGIIIKDGKLLLGEKKKSEIGTGFLNGPGGKFEADTDTDMIDCMVREAEEELGITLAREHLMKIAVIMFYAAGEPFFECHIFRTETFGGEPVETKSMIPRGYFECDKIPYALMHEGDDQLFPKFLSGEKFNANVYYLRPGEGLDPENPVEFLPFEDTEAA